MQGRLPLSAENEEGRSASQLCGVCDAFPNEVPAKARYVRHYLQLPEFGLRFMNKSGQLFKGKDQEAQVQHSELICI
jgi:hypothetical protein